MIITNKLLIIMSLLPFFSCKPKEKTVNNPVDIESCVELSGFSMSCNHIRFPECYSFSLNQNKGIVVFSASCDVEKDGNRIEIKQKQVSQDFWDEFILLSKKLKICDFPEYQHIKPDVDVYDRTEYDMSLSFVKSSRRINPDSEKQHILEEFFFNKAKSESTEQILE
jgi:hypothetical protein